jgi:hypothetical protein
VSWLGQQRELKASFSALGQNVGYAGLTGNQQDFRCRILLHDGDRQFDSVHRRHHDVRQHIIRTERGCHFQSAETLIRGLRLKAGAAKNCSRGVREQPLIIDDENPRLRCSPSLGIRFRDLQLRRRSRKFICEVNH